MSGWYEDEEFWRETYPFMFPVSRFSEAEDQADELLKLVGRREGRVLDLGCGPGRFSLALSSRSMEVTGVDRTDFLLEKARNSAQAAGLSVEFVKADMRDFRRPCAFDLVLSLFTSFGYFEDAEDDLKTLRRCLENLRPGGCLVLDVMGKERLARILKPVAGEELPDGSKLVELHTVIDDWTRLRNEWIVIRDGRARTFHFDLRVYSGLELKDRMLDVGFDSVRLFGGLDGSSYDADAKRLVAVGRRAP